MHTTRITLLQRLGEGDVDAWNELYQVYCPLMTNWLRRFSLSNEDIEDLTQEIMTVVARQIGEFEHNGLMGAFRSWLRTTAANLARNHLRKKKIVASGSMSLMKMLDQLQDSSSSIAQQFDREHDRYVVRRLLERASAQFAPQTMAIFRMHVIRGVSARDTAARVGVSAVSVHTAKSRVLRWLRQHAADWGSELYLD